MATILLSVDGIPRPQPRPRFYKGRVISTADANARRWINLIESAARVALDAAGKVEGPIAVALHFAFPTKDKTRWGKPHTARPDADNLAKLVLDAVMRAGLIGDDSGVARLVIVKAWASSGGLEAAFGTVEGKATPDPSKDPLEHPRWLN